MTTKEEAGKQRSKSWKNFFGFQSPVPILKKSRNGNKQCNTEGETTVYAVYTNFLFQEQRKIQNRGPSSFSLLPLCYLVKVICQVPPWPIAFLSFFFKKGDFYFIFLFLGKWKRKGNWGVFPFLPFLHPYLAFLLPPPFRPFSHIFFFSLLLHNNWHFAAFEMWEIAVERKKKGFLFKKRKKSTFFTYRRLAGKMLREGKIISFCFLLLRESEVCRSSAPLAFKSQKLRLCVLRTYALSQFGRRRMHLRCETKKRQSRKSSLSRFCKWCKREVFFFHKCEFF